MSQELLARVGKVLMSHLLPLKEISSRLLNLHDPNTAVMIIMYLTDVVLVDIEPRLFEGPPVDVGDRLGIRYLRIGNADFFISHRHLHRTSLCLHPAEL